LSGSRTGTEHRDTGFTQSVGYARDQRRLGTDDDEIDSALSG
jgi:hypothetical protein